mmetsp:Transcript_18950/g.31397  ORF Transcript_18950/g.31397 Transcript_18950/m.31397 type:complete len:278 (+) Transcript_18950:26-859(+)|eukprot:CAMPEP_0119016300 /NCGR_PEP_ID=MMETSP1176-20130426/11922_1 /TAXON_ID=265551 /ORGANISM="Synedropsis recta cf, Strain CCMP1620" /LENGTH=277 /DNA_ID=CAMNT_0006969643 /DNA_START=21 /DNA_END=854 /DNA_ORIENTATION=+
MPKTSSRRKSVALSSKEDAKTQPVGLVPTDKDVLLGRGRTNFFHQGNVRFREIVGSKLNVYLCATSKSHKSEIVRAIADEVLADARFLKQHGANTFTWYDAGIKAARAKVGHALRDASSDKSRSIKKIHLDLLRKNSSCNKKRKNLTKISAIEATSISCRQTLGLAGSVDESDLQVSSTKKVPMGSVMNDVTNIEDLGSSLALDEPDKFMLPLQADWNLSDVLHDDILNLRPSTSPDFSCAGSLDDYLEIVNDIDIEDLEAYLVHALDCTRGQVQEV